VSENIQLAQDQQKISYAKRHPRSDNLFNVGDKVLLKNLRREDRKGGWALMPWIGPYIIHEIINNNLCILKNGEKILKTKQLLKNIKKFHESSKPTNTNSTSEENMDIEWSVYRHYTFKTKFDILIQLVNTDNRPSVGHLD